MRKLPVVSVILGVEARKIERINGHNPQNYHLCPFWQIPNKENTFSSTDTNAKTARCVRFFDGDEMVTKALIIVTKTVTKGRKCTKW